MTELAELQADLCEFRADITDWASNCPNECAYWLAGDDPADPRARKLWEQRVSSSRYDIEAAHHLAVACHCSAFDLELEGAKGAFDEWRTALSLWARVIAADVFWSGLASRLTEAFGDAFNERSVTELRGNTPRWLLEVHAGFIRAYAEPDRARAARHMELIRSAPFDSGLIESVRQELYREVAQAANGDLAANNFDSALSRLRQWLEIDPGYIPALRHAVGTANDWNELHWLDNKNITAMIRTTNMVKAYAAGLEPAGNDPMVATVLAQFWFFAGLCEDDRPKEFEKALQRRVQPSSSACAAAVKEYSAAVDCYRNSYRFDGGQRVQVQTNRLRMAYVQQAMAMFVQSGHSFGTGRTAGFRKSLAALEQAEKYAADGGDKDLMSQIESMKGQTLAAIALRNI